MVRLPCASISIMRDLRVTMESPPFRALSSEEKAAAVDRINTSGAGIVFVGLCCPKQERWMAGHRGRDALDENPLRVRAVMIGVGAEAVSGDEYAVHVRRSAQLLGK